MKKRTKKDAAFALQIAEKFSAAIHSHGLTRDDAAKVLGVKRASIYKYLRGDTIPGSNVLQRACRKWGLELNYKGVTFDYSSFVNRERKSTRGPVQMSLPFVREALRGRNIEIEVRRAEPDSIRLILNIKIAG